jgi:hypothetical protein
MSTNGPVLLQRKAESVRTDLRRGRSSTEDCVGMMQELSMKNCAIMGGILSERREPPNSTGSGGGGSHIAPILRP